MVKTHDKEYFHKYATSEATLRILDSLRLKWSSPTLFNDPFDIQVDIRFPFAPDTLLPRMVAEIDRVLFETEEPREVSAGELFDTLRALRRDRAMVPRDGLAPWLEAHFGGLFRSVIADLLRRANTDWREWWRDKRLLCVAEDHDDLLMWAHYAQSHSGAVLRLRCLPERDTALCAAMPVHYHDTLPSLGDVDTWARCVVGTGPTPLGADVFKQYWLTKSSHWAYEKEWRAITKVDRDDEPGYALLDIYPQEIDTLFLGCRMPDRVKADVMGRLTRSLAHVRVMQARRSDTHFVLQFDTVREGAGR